MKYLYFFGIIAFLHSCDRNRGVSHGVDANRTIDSIDTLNITPIYPEKIDPEWFNKDLFKSNEQYRLLESIESFKIKFDSIQKLCKWNLIISKDVEKPVNDSIVTFNVQVDPGHFNHNIKIIARLQKENKKVIKLMVFADGYGDGFDRTVIRVIKAIILSTLNSNYNSDDAELLIHQTGILNDAEYSPPGVLLKNGFRYESHQFEDKFYFGVTTNS